MRPSDIDEMGPLLVGGQPRADALGHDQHDGSVAEVELLPVWRITLTTFVVWEPRSPSTTIRETSRRSYRR